MEKEAKIYIAGHNGLVGSALTSALLKRGYRNLLFKNFHELDLTDQSAVSSFFQKEKPEYVFLAAAKVGGIMANSTYRAQFIYENLMIQNNVIHQSYLHGVKKLLFLGSTCIYPKNCPQPMKEEYLLTGSLEETNEPYAIAKIAGLKMCESYNRQYGTTFISVMPTNLYGPNDNFDLEKSHVLPALLRKIHLGKCLENGDWDTLRKDLNVNPIKSITGANSEQEILSVLAEFGIRPLSPLNPKLSTLNSQLSPLNSKPSTLNSKLSVAVSIWGSGSPLREFMYSEDMASACLHIMNSEEAGMLIKQNPSHSWINIGSGEEISIAGLAELIKKLVGFEGTLQLDPDKPDGTPRKLTDVSRLSKLGYVFETKLEAGIILEYASYMKVVKETV